MMRPPPKLTIHESRIDGSARLSLTGALDVASAPALEDRLTGLRARKSPVSLDRSNLDSARAYTG